MDEATKQEIEALGNRFRHNPTPEEIREHCLRFQAGWSDLERRRRAGERLRKDELQRPTWSAPEVELQPLGLYEVGAR